MKEKAERPVRRPLKSPGKTEWWLTVEMEIRE